MLILLLAVACSTDEGDIFLYGPTAQIFQPDAEFTLGEPGLFQAEVVDADGRTANADLIVLWNWTADGKADTIDGDPPGDDNIATWEWTPERAGETLITLTVRDDDGGEGLDSLTVTVADQ